MIQLERFWFWSQRFQRSSSRTGRFWFCLQPGSDLRQHPSYEQLQELKIQQPELSTSRLKHGGGSMMLWNLLVFSTS